MLEIQNLEKQIEKKEGKVIFCVEDLEKQRWCKIEKDNPGY